MPWQRNYSQALKLARENADSAERSVEDAIVEVRCNTLCCAGDVHTNVGASVCVCDIDIVLGCWGVGVGACALVCSNHLACYIMSGRTIQSNRRSPLDGHSDEYQPSGCFHVRGGADCSWSPKSAIADTTLAGVSGGDDNMQRSMRQRTDKTTAACCVPFLTLCS